MNMGKVDRIARAIVGLILVLIAFFIIAGVAQIVLWIIGGILLLTAIIGFCPLYYPFHFSTKNDYQDNAVILVNKHANM